MSLGTDKLKLNRGLVLSLPFSEGVGTQVRDVTRPHHPFSLMGTPTWVQSSGGVWAINFVKAASTDYLVCSAASCADLNFQQTGFSAVAWINVPAGTSGAGGIMGRGDRSTTGWAFNHVSSDIQFRGGFETPSNGTATNDQRATQGSWHLVGFSVYSGASAVSPCYVDGKNGNSYSVWSTHTVGDLSAHDYHIGRMWTGSWFWFNGQVSKPRLWNRVLTPSEHSEIFNRERALFGV